MATTRILNLTAARKAEVPEQPVRCLDHRRLPIEVRVLSGGASPEHAVVSTRGLAMADGRPLGSWLRVSPRTLLHLPADSPAWVLLRSVGIRRPSPSGTRQTRATRKPETRPAPLRLSREAGAALAALAAADGLSPAAELSAVVLGVARVRGVVA